MKLFFHLLLIACICMCLVNCAQKDGKTKKSERQEKQFRNQLRSLFRLGCRPVRCKVPIKSLLDSTNILHDLDHVYPQYAVIKKCQESCSFCKFKQDKLGIENKLCKAKRSKTKRVLVKYFNNETSIWEFERVETKEDKRCECMGEDD